MKKKLLFAVILFSPLLLRSQTEGIDIRGIVSDSLTGQRIPFANVVLFNTTRGAAANNAGFYLIPTVPFGEYTISARVIGYEAKTQHVRVQGNKPLEINFRLTATLVKIDEVVITGAQRRELTEINPSVHVLDQQTIHLIPVATQEDVFQSLRMLPGVVTTGDVSSKFYVRGGAGDQNLVLLDGVKIYNPFHALGIFSVFDPDIVQNVELYSGAFPAGFGGRLSSVINIESREGRADRIAGRANINFLSSKLELEGPTWKNTTMMFNARKSLFSQTFKSLIKDDLPISFYDVIVKLTTKTTSGAKLDGIFIATSDDLKSTDPLDPDYFWQNTAFAVTTSSLLTDRLFINATVYGTSFKTERDTKSSIQITPASSSVKEVGLRTNATIYTDSHDLFFFGFEFSFPSYEYNLINILGSSIFLYGAPVEASTWVRYQTKLDRLRLEAGLHAEIGSLFDKRDLAQGVLQPRINLSYEMWGNWKTKVSYGRVSQNVITLSNEDDIISIFDAWAKVPDYLPSEVSDHFVLGWDGNATEHISLDIQGYYKYYSSLVAYNRNKVDALDPDYIIAKGKSYGAELLLRSHFSFIDLYATYILGWTTINNEGFTYYPRYDRRHHINVLTIFQPLENFMLTFRWEYGSSLPFTQSIGYVDRLHLQNTLPGPFEYETGTPFILLGAKNASRLPDYHRLDASASYKFNLVGLHTIAEFNIINVYNSKNIFYFDRKTGQRVNMISFFPSVSLTVEY